MLANRMKQRREALELSIETMALWTHIPLERYITFEANEVLPETSEIVLLARHLGCTVPYLLGLVDAPQKAFVEVDLSPDEQRFLEAYQAGRIPQWMLNWIEKSAERSQKRQRRK